jgi:hypothetical protein
MSDKGFFFFKIYYVLWVHCSCLQTQQKRASSPIIDGCEPPCACWELNSGPLETATALNHWAISPAPGEDSLAQYTLYNFSFLAAIETRLIVYPILPSLLSLLLPFPPPPSLPLFSPFPFSLFPPSSPSLPLLPLSPSPSSFPVFLLQFLLYSPQLPTHPSLCSFSLF